MPRALWRGGSADACHAQAAASAAAPAKLVPIRQGFVVTNPDGCAPPPPLRSAAWHVTGGVLQTCLAPCASRILHLSSWGGCLLRLPVWPLHAVLALVLS